MILVKRDRYGLYCEIVLHNGMIAKVDPEHYEELSKYRWTALWANKNQFGQPPKWYAKRTSQNQNVYMHRLIAGIPVFGLKCDHRNGDSLDNRSGNVRPATDAQNNSNRPIPRNNTSGFKGVSRVDSRDKVRWRAKLIHHKKTLHLGTFDTPVEAARAYDRKVLEVNPEFGTTNFPREDYT